MMRGSKGLQVEVKLGLLLRTQPFVFGAHALPELQGRPVWSNFQSIFSPNKLAKSKAVSIFMQGLIDILIVNVIFNHHEEAYGVFRTVDTFKLMPPESGRTIPLINSAVKTSGCLIKWGGFVTYLYSRKNAGFERSQVLVVRGNTLPFRLLWWQTRYHIQSDVFRESFTPVHATEQSVFTKLQYLTPNSPYSMREQLL